MCPAWHNEEWPDDECDDPDHGCHQVAQYRRDRLAENPSWYDSICGLPGPPGPPGPARQRKNKKRKSMQFDFRSTRKLKLTS